MHSAGLKVNIAGTLLLLLTCAVMLGSLIIVMFWQREAVIAEVGHTKTIARLWERTMNDRGVQDGIGVADLQQLRRMIGPLCMDAAVLSGSIFLSAEKSEVSAKLEQALLQAARTKQDVARFTGTAVGGSVFGEKQLILAVSIKEKRDESMVVGVVVRVRTALDVFQQHQRIILVYALMNIILLTVVGLFRFFGLVVRPIERLVKTSESYDYGDGISFLVGEAKSEIGQLSFALNRMLARIEEDREKLRFSVRSLEQANEKLVNTQKEMVRAEKLAALGRLSAGLAHEIGNPLGIVQGYVELLMHENLSRDDRRQFTQRAIAELQRVDSLVRQLLNLARTANLTRENISAQVLVAEIVDIFSQRKRGPRITMKMDCAEGADKVLVNVEELKQVFLNCLLNSADGIAEKGDDVDGAIAIDCKCLPEGRQVVRIAIEDNGTGIEAANLEAIFDPFMTTKSPGKGTGLGLSISNSIIQSAGGRIWAENNEGGGARIVIELPLADFRDDCVGDAHGQG